MNSHTRLALVLLLTLLVAQPASAGKPRKQSKQEVAARAAAREKWKKVAQLRKETAVKIEEKQSDTEILRGFVTYALPNPEAPAQTLAYVYLQWGDLDNKIKGRDKDAYQDWSGYVRVNPGRVTLVEGYAFDDGGPKRDKRIADATDRHAEARRKALREVEEDYEKRLKALLRRKNTSSRPKALRNLKSWRRRQLRTVDQRYAKQQQRTKAGFKAREGSDRDETLVKRTRSQVVWKAGTVGTTDGLLFRVDLDGATTTGEIKAGRFTIPFAVVPKPDDAKPEPKRSG